MNPQQQWYDGSMAGLAPQLSEWQQRCIDAMDENGTLKLQVEALEYMVLGNNEGQVDRGTDPVAALANLVNNHDLMDNQRFVERLVLRILLDQRLIERANREVTYWANTASPYPAKRSDVYSKAMDIAFSKHR